MSFYGSVYYQLIDTFYKVLISNNGLNGIEFPAELNTDDQTMRAYGRKGVLELETGNRWVTFTQEVDEENNTLKYVLWHNAPVAEGSDGNFDSFCLQPDDLVIPEGTENYIELQPGQYFTSQKFKYDNAGHIVPETDEVTIYKLPISEVEQAIGEYDISKGTIAVRLDNIETTIGDYDDGVPEDDDGTTLPRTIAGDLVTLDKRATKVEDLFGSDDKEMENPIEGAANVFFKSPYIYGYGDKNQLKSFADAFGSIDEVCIQVLGGIADTTDDKVENHRTISNSIIRINTGLGDLQSHVGNLDRLVENLGNISDDHETRLDGHDNKIQSIESTIATMQQTDTNLQNQINTTNTNLSSLDGRVVELGNTLNAKDTNLQNQINANDTDIENLQAKDKSLDAEIAGLKARDEAFDTDSQAIHSSIEGLVEADLEINGRINSLSSDYNSHKSAVESYMSTSSSLHSSVSNNISALQKDLYGAEKIFATAQEISDVYETKSAAADFATSVSTTYATIQSLNEYKDAVATSYANKTEFEESKTAIEELSGLVTTLSERVAALEAEIKVLKGEDTEAPGNGEEPETPENGEEPDVSNGDEVTTE